MFTLSFRHRWVHPVKTADIGHTNKTLFPPFNVTLVTIREIVVLFLYVTGQIIFFQGKSNIRGKKENSKFFVVGWKFHFCRILPDDHHLLAVLLVLVSNHCLNSPFVLRKF